MAIPLLLAALPLAAVAQEYPERAITIVTSMPPGGSVDGSLRAIAAILSNNLGQPVVIENKPGAGGQIAATAVKSARPDGYTLLLADHAILAVNPHLFAKLAYSPSEDFVPVTNLVSWPHILVIPASSPYKNVHELMNAAQAGKAINYASQGMGSGGHLLGEMFRSKARFPATHVAYKGAHPAAMDLIGGRVDYFFDGVTILPYVADGKARALGVAGESRMPLLPNVPTMAELGYPEVNMRAWFGIVAPKGTPDGIVNRLNSELVKAANSPALLARFNEQGISVVTGSPEEFARFSASERVRLGEYARVSGASSN